MRRQAQQSAHLRQRLYDSFTFARSSGLAYCAASVSMSHAVSSNTAAASCECTGVRITAEPNADGSPPCLSGHDTEITCGKLVVIRRHTTLPSAAATDVHSGAKDKQRSYLHAMAMEQNEAKWEL